MEMVYKDIPDFTQKQFLFGDTAFVEQEQQPEEDGLKLNFGAEKEETIIDSTLGDTAPLKHNEKAFVEPRRTTKTKFKRWDREDDKRLFGIIRSLWEDDALLLKDVLEDEKYDFSTDFSLIDKIAQLSKWRGPIQTFVARIRVQTEKQSFSVREMKHMTKLIKRNTKNSETGFKNIIYHFPGKTEQNVYQTWERCYLNLKQVNQTASSVKNLNMD